MGRHRAFGDDFRSFGDDLLIQSIITAKLTVVYRANVIRRQCHNCKRQLPVGGYSMKIVPWKTESEQVLTPGYPGAAREMGESLLISISHVPVCLISGLMIWCPFQPLAKGLVTSYYSLMWHVGGQLAPISVEQLARCQRTPVNPADA